uniref:Annexin n=1 Tax=Ananas comosus var. bracteatus TaxID=296719 RepID=A0A6V7PCH1_ANACO|nr:unnamed protein product [Ananas comosus var. bracteatus]
MCLSNFPPFNLLLHHLTFFLRGDRHRLRGAGDMASIAVPDPTPPPALDAENIRKAVQGWGTDEKKLIEILGRRTAAQRAAIACEYARLYNESLLDRLHSELSGDFRSAMMLWTVDPAERDAKLVNKALRRKDDNFAMRKTDEHYIWVIVEVACASSPDHLMAVRKAYCSKFSSSLEEDVASCSYKDPIRQFLVGLVSSYRYTDDYVDEGLAKSEATELCNAIRKKQPHHEDVLRIISLRNKSQLKATFKHYKQDFGKAIDEDIESYGSSLFSRVLRAAVLCLGFPEKHFAEVIRYSIQGLGTDEGTLTRAIVSRAEIDMNNIKEVYKIMYNTTLTREVTGDTSGFYKDILLTLIGSEE